MPAAPIRATDAVHPIFKDVAAAAGVHFTESNGATGKFYYIESTPGGCAFFDYDNDGYPDILLIQSGRFPRTPANSPSNWCRLYHNNGNGTFTDVTAGSGLDRDLGYCQGVAVGDYDNDGYDDLYITAYGGNHLLRNLHGTGRFEDVTSRAGVGDTDQGPRYATSAAFGDYDNDGHLDLYVCHYSPWTVARNRVCSNARGESDYCSPYTLDPDVDRLYHNNGNGTFTDVTKSSGITSAKGRGLGVAWLDYDGDGREDIYVCNDLTPAILWHNDGHGKFSNRALQAGCAYDSSGAEIAGMGLGVGDYDNSGRESLFVANFSGQPNTLFHNVGGGQFVDVSNAAGVAQPHMKYLTFGADFIDYNADGWKDIINANGHVEIHAPETYNGTTYPEPKQLYHNDGNGKFSLVTRDLGDLNTPVVSRGLAVGDYDNDGRLDILVNNQNGPAQLFHNEVRNAGNWISFKLIGTKSNRDGYGAKVNVTCGKRHYFSECRGSSSFESHSDSRVYFGLGAATRVDAVTIRWPSGAHDQIRDLSADHIYTVTETRGVTGVFRRQQPKDQPGARVIS